MPAPSEFFFLVVAMTFVVMVWSLWPEKLSGWQRVGVVAGVVASLVWAGFAVVLVDKHERWASKAFGVCLDGQQKQPAKAESDKPQPTCIETYFKNQDKETEHVRTMFVVYSVVPIGLGWLTVLGIANAIVWVRRGFKDQS